VHTTIANDRPGIAAHLTVSRGYHVNNDKEKLLRV